MKILHIIQYFQENMGYQDNVLPIAQSDMGNKVYIVTSNRECEYLHNRKHRIKKIGIKIYKGVTLIRNNIYFELKNRFVIFKDLSKIIDKIQPDCIFHHGLTLPSLFTALKYKKNNPNIILVCDSHAMHENTAINAISYFYHKTVWGYILRKKIKFIDKIFYIAPECLDFIKEIYNISEEVLNFLPLGGDISNLNNYKFIRDEYRDRLNIKKEELLIIHAGKMVPAKQTEKLLNSFKYINEKNIRLILIGSISKEYKKLLNKIINNDKRIDYIGWKNPEELAKIFCAGDILIQPGSASVIFEQAICSGLPIVLKKTKLGQYLTSKGSGIILKKDDEKEISKIIIQLNRNRKILKKMHINTINFAQKELSYKEIAKKSLSLIEDTDY